MKVRIDKGGKEVVVVGSDLIIFFKKLRTNSTFIFYVSRRVFPLVRIKKKKITIRKKYNLERTIIKK
jgi:hypothetical protein